MRKWNLLTYAIFFVFVAVYWAIRKTGAEIDSRMYLMVMIFVLFLLYVIRKIVLFQKIHDIQDPYERSYDHEDTVEHTEPVPTSPIEDMRKEDKKLSAKKGLFVILAFVMMIGFRYGSELFLKDMLLDGFDTTEEFFAEVERKQEFRQTWEEYRKEEMKNGGPAYLPEDVFAATLRPDHWDDFFVLTDIPEGFYYRDRYMQSSSPGDYIITEVFYDLETETEFFYFVQSADYDYNKGHVPDGVKKKEGQFYTEEKGARNQIIWFYNDLTLYLEGSLPVDELQQIAESAVNYNTLSYDYSAIEEMAGTYE
ncbi:MAG: hypothetical protein IJA25_03675 [Anaerotignum sp.]|nr:hypothetical protein [Anaerotignum sp.]